MIPPSLLAATLTAYSAADPAASVACAEGTLVVHFYDVGQALAVLVDLPDGRHLLVDAGESPRRAGCGRPCRDAHIQLMRKLQRDLHGDAIDLLFITHQHSDHLGGALDILQSFSVHAYVDNGRDLDAHEVQATRHVAALRSVPVSVVEPEHVTLPISDSPRVQIRALAPSRWLGDCDVDRNHCSIMLRLDFGASSVLFTGDEELAEEPLLNRVAPATLLQVGHHGSETSSGPAFLQALRPKYAVISVGKQGEGMNRTFCHPRASTILQLTQALGGAKDMLFIRAFESQNRAVECRCSSRHPQCHQGTAKDWVDLPASDRLWVTARDGDVVLSTCGNGVFVRTMNPSRQN